jgi:hypothetical protein
MERVGRGEVEFLVGICGGGALFASRLPWGRTLLECSVSISASELSSLDNSGLSL